MPNLCGIQSAALAQGCRIPGEGSGLAPLPRYRPGEGRGLDPHPPTQGRPRPRDGAATPVLGTLPLNPSRRSSTGNPPNAPSRGGVGRGPAAPARLDSGRKGRKEDFAASIQRPHSCPPLRGKGLGVSCVQSPTHITNAPDRGMSARSA